MTNRISNDELLSIVTGVARKHHIDVTVLAERTYDHVSGFNTTPSQFKPACDELAAALATAIEALNESPDKSQPTTVGMLLDHMLTW